MSTDALGTARSQELAAYLLTLVDALARGESEDHLLRRLAHVMVRVPGVEAAACSLIGPEGIPWRMAASDDRSRRLECLQAESRVGPRLDISYGGGPLANIPMSHPHSRTRWPRFTSRALSEGFTAVTALPLAHQDCSLGALDLYHQYGRLEPSNIRWARLLADAAAVGLAHRDLLRNALVRSDQLQNALNSRVVIEQAKGILAERLDCDLQEAFEQLRGHARAKRMKLTDLAALTVGNPSDSSPFPRQHRAG
ncbi:GAF and ANTAR domain-containing protein [Streptomyces sp. NPDC102365]|uniref:GAF and ANTAR domain-containing protein n=1 Tax=Streptomyces sp. NPDC102365 TaxID=3366162 RepID=UPI003802CA96